MMDRAACDVSSTTSTSKLGLGSEAPPQRCLWLAQALLWSSASPLCGGRSRWKPWGYFNFVDTLADVSAVVEVLGRSSAAIVAGSMHRTAHCGYCASPYNRSEPKITFPIRGRSRAWAARAPHRPRAAHAGVARVGVARAARGGRIGRRMGGERAARERPIGTMV